MTNTENTTMLRTRALRSCPYCGSDAARLVVKEVPNGTKYISVHCPICKARGPELTYNPARTLDITTFEADAVKGWNHRSGDMETLTGARIDFIYSMELTPERLEDMYKSFEALWEHEKEVSS